MTISSSTEQRRRRRSLSDLRRSSEYLRKLREWQDLTNARSTRGPECFIESHVAKDLVQESVCANCFNQTENAMNEDINKAGRMWRLQMVRCTNWMFPSLGNKIYAYGI